MIPFIIQRDRIKPKSTRPTIQLKCIVEMQSSDKDIVTNAFDRKRMKRRWYKKIVIHFYRESLRSKRISQNCYVFFGRFKSLHLVRLVKRNS